MDKPTRRYRAGFSILELEMAKHGTTTMYRNGCRCDECKAAKAKEKAEYTARKKSGAFTPKQREKRVKLCGPIVLCMSRDFKISQQDIARAFGCSHGTVVKALHDMGYKPGKNTNDKKRAQLEHERALAEFKRRIADEYGGRFDVIEHRRHSSVLKCRECGETFSTTKSSGISCPICAKRRRSALAAMAKRAKERERAERIADTMAKAQTCEWCGGEFHAEHERRFCSSACAQRSAYAKAHPKVVKVCPTCGESFESYNSRNRYCSRECWKESDDHKKNRKKHRTKNYRHRARMYGAEYVSGITLGKVYEKDGGTCYLCGQHTDFHDIYESGAGYAVGPHYPTIDHVKPLSKGGGHIWENVRLACHRCNSLKGAS